MAENKGNHAVFYDSSRRRWPLLKRTAAFLAVIAALCAAVFLTSLVFLPAITPAIDSRVSQRHSPRTSVLHLPRRKRQLQRFALAGIRRDFQRAARGESKAAITSGGVAVKSPRIVGAFYAIWQESGLHSLRAQSGRINHLFPEWVHVSSDGLHLDLRDWNPDVIYHNREVEAIARQNGIALMPVINNAAGGTFSGERVKAILSDTASADRFISELKKWLLGNRYQGVNVDFELLSPDEYKLLPAFLSRLRGELAPSGLAVSLDIEPDNRHLDWKAASAACDFIILMCYDEHDSTSEPGPVASAEWHRSVLDRALLQIPPGKLVAGIGNYAYDWNEKTGRARSMTFQEAVQQSRDYHPDDKYTDIIDFDSRALNPTYNYADDDGVPHEVWMLDGITAANQYEISRRAGLRGSAVWLLGSEDPSIWTFLDRARPDAAPDVSLLRKISFPYGVEFIGDGDVLRIKTMPSVGERELDSDPSTGLFTDEKYLSYPSSFVINRTGYVKGKIALTFDDGPWEPYTSEILDVLKETRAPATFFVIGENLERHPDVVERIWNEGHEIGNHSYTHPDMGNVSETRAVMELSATERALQSILGRSTILFRPPYNADAEPTTEDEVLAVKTASRLGYITVGEYIDPQDWYLRMEGPAGRPVPRTAMDIAEKAMAGVRAGHGSTILFHDGGGDRSRTVEALRILIPMLRKEGYELVRVSDLIDSDREDIMPVSTAKDRFVIGVDRVVFEVTYGFRLFLRVAFIAAIVIGLLRLAIVIALAWRARREESGKAFPAGYRPAVSILVPAYNERAVICGTIAAILKSDFLPAEIIVVDDGSTDGTAEEVLSRYGNNPLVKVLRQPNKGKGAALNDAIAASSGEILVCLDADTQFLPDTISLLVRHFSDARVGAVAGNIRVGNTVNILTRWQAIEYSTNQNLDRRAYGLVNAVTVVPGAVGAWRKIAVVAAGGYSSDTLAEDMDLTWRLRAGGWLISNEPLARGFTEAPDTLGTLFRQRFRWTFGTLQCLWKHRRMTFREGWFGWFVLPSVWLFQVVFQLLSPIVDLMLVWSAAGVVQWLVFSSSAAQDWQPLWEALSSFYYVGIIYLIFALVDLAVAASAFYFEKEDYPLMWWVFPQRFAYRQIMYAIAIKSVFVALKGIYAGWGKIERKGTVNLSAGEGKR